MKIINEFECNECVLKEISIFKNCKKSETDNLLSDKTIYEFQQNETIIKQNTPFKNVICIQEGVIKVFKTNKKKDELIFWFALPGDLLGLDAFINKENYSFSAIAIEPVHACLISEQDLNNIIENKPDISIELMKNLCEKIEFMEKRVTSIAQKEVKGQLAEILLLLSKKNKITNKIVQINYTIKDLANIIGTTKNYIYKILSDFSEHRIIVIENKKIKIIDAVKLSRIAAGN